ncbi:hypothetical protein [Shinella sp. M31]|uniref:hypothetical protein n=1 Tax=Shinella sp. M31 TaxID=3368615 RepID=UPI003BA2128B
MKKTTIEALLAWAFTQELPKVGAGDGGSAVSASSWNVIADIAALGTIIDRNPNRYGAIPGYIYEGEPAHDAVIVGEAVRALATRGGYEIAEGWFPFPDWADPHGLVGLEVDKVIAEQRNRSDRLSGSHVVNLVMSAAKLGRGPCWQADEPRSQVMRSSNGKDIWFVMRTVRDRTGARYIVEDNGYDAKRHRPKKGAYRKYKLESPVRGAILSRLDWQLWQSALQILHESLQDRLTSHTLQEFHPDRHPWRRQEMAGKNTLSI